jgi:serine/threonine protein kinase
LVTDGAYEFLTAPSIVEIVQQCDGNLDRAAQQVVDQAFTNGSDDNITAQIVRVDRLPSAGARDLQQQLRNLPLPPQIAPRMEFDGYRIVRQIHTSSRSHVYLAIDLASQLQVAIKMPSMELRSDNDYLERFLLEEWIARRIDNVHVVKPCFTERPRSYLYIVSEYISGQTLSQWMIDNPRPNLESVRNIIEQVAKGLRAFHRLEMIHQDIRPDNILLDHTGTVKIIDFGSTSVSGITEIAGAALHNPIPGTAQYTAPEYFLGDPGSPTSDLFSLGVITYQMLSGRLPYGTEIAKCRTAAAQKKLVYKSVLDDEREIPIWIDHTLKKSVHINPYKRYSEFSEFLYDLRHPSRAFITATRPPLLERNPLMFWQLLSLILAVVVVVLSARLAG